MKCIYLDWNASAPVHPEAREAVAEALDKYHANPSSAHKAGQEARRAVEEARGAVASLIGAQPEEIVFTGGGSEANSLALSGVLQRKRGRVITSVVEHPSVYRCLEGMISEEQITRLPVSPAGRVVADELEECIRADTVLLSVMRANNETGVVQPVGELARRARGRGALVHTDAIQAAAKIPVSVGDLDVDLLTLSSHKMRGPKGVGALFVRKGVELTPIVWGGGQEMGLRAGTENVPGIVGMGRAAEVARRELNEIVRKTGELRDLLEKKLTSSLPDAVVQGHGVERLPNTCSISFPGVEGFSLLQLLDLKGVTVSTAAACHSGASDYSHVMRAMGVKPELARGTLRLSLGPSTTREEVERAAEMIVSAVGELR